MRKINYVLFSILASFSVLAEGGYAEVATVSGFGNKGIYAIGACLCMVLAAVGAATAQGKTASTALDGIARNPSAQAKIFIPMIVALALIESMAIFAFLVANTVAGKI